MMNSNNDFFQHFDEQPFHKYLGMTIEETGVDYARLRLQKTETTPSGIGGSVNGGVIATLVDIAALPAVLRAQREEARVVAPDALPHRLALARLLHQVTLHDQTALDVLARGVPSISHVDGKI